MNAEKTEKTSISLLIKFNRYRYEQANVNIWNLIKNTWFVFNWDSSSSLFYDTFNNAIWAIYHNDRTKINTQVPT